MMMFLWSLIVLCLFDYSVANGANWIQINQDDGDGKIGYYDIDSVRTIKGNIKKFWLKIKNTYPVEVDHGHDIQYFYQVVWQEEFACKTRRFRSTACVMYFTDNSNQVVEKIEPWRDIIPDTLFDKLHQRICR
jgi:glucan biosynthesis protein